MENTFVKDKEEEQILRICQNLLLLMKRAPNEWVKWRALAKQIAGVDEMYPVYQGYCQLEKWSHLFYSTEFVVKLSEDGIRFVSGRVPEEISEIESIANGVISYASSLKRIFIYVNQIAYIAHVGKKYVHAFFTEVSDEYISSECPVEFYSNDGSSGTYGKIVGQEIDGSVLYIAFDTHIHEASLPGRISIDRGFLLNQLANKISKLETIPPLFSKILLREDGESSINVNNEDSLYVSEGLFHLKTPWSKFLWGPPGAGKTFVLGHLIKQILVNNSNEKTLIVAPSNRAVDVAVEQLINQFSEYEKLEFLMSRRILRYGYPRKREILENTELLGPSNLSDLQKQIKDTSVKISKAEKNNDISSLVILRAQILDLQEEVKNAIKEHVKGCSVVATTTTLSFMASSPISEINWDNVIVDEVTMVTPALCLFLASLSVKRFLIAGDPRQLGPVYENNIEASETAQKWMGKDIFDLCGIGDELRENTISNKTDNRLIKITSQRRCSPPIWNCISELYPDVINLSNKEQVSFLSNLPPHPGFSIILLDTSTSSQGYTCEKKSHSWMNEFNAELAIEVVSTLVSETQKNISIAMISPYRAQVNLARSYIAQELKAELTPWKNNLVECGTVHQFQGSDADIIIFDIVDGMGRPNLGALLRGETGKRLVNVAISRAKGKLIIIADIEWCRQVFEKYENPLLWNLLFQNQSVKRIRVFPPESRTECETESPIEEMLLSEIKKRNKTVKVVPQYKIFDKNNNVVSRVDFAFLDVKYAIFCDGQQWHVKQNYWQRDVRKRNCLTELGWKYSIYTGSDIYSDTARCVDQIMTTYSNLLKNR